jgi:hypothetical protein
MENETIQVVSSSLVTEIVLPVILAFIGIVGVFIRNMLKKLSDYAMTKITDQTQATIVTNVLSQIDNIAAKAVASNMELAERYKKASEDGKLTEDEINELRAIAKTKINCLLPKTITSEDVIALIGGPAVLDALIKESIDKAVIELKNKM